MENNETSSQAAQRETIEEASANVELHELFSILNVPHVHQVHLFYRATCLIQISRLALKALKSNCFPEHEIPLGRYCLPDHHRLYPALFFFDDHRRQHGGRFELRP